MNSIGDDGNIFRWGFDKLSRYILNSIYELIFYIYQGII